MANASLVGIGSFVPARRITNQHWESLVDTTDAWIRENIGIVERSRVEPGMTTVDMGIRAARRALESAGIEPGRLDRIVCATNTQGYLYPSTASQIQEQLGAHSASSLDVQAGCTGWLYALQLATALIEADRCGPILVVGTDALSLALNMYDRNSLLFGDAAGAAVLVAGPAHPRLPRPIFSQRTTPSMAMRQPTVVDEERNRFEDYLEGRDMRSVSRPLPHMDGRTSLRLALQDTRACLDDVLTEAASLGITTADIDVFVPHQTNAKVRQALCDHIGYPVEKVPPILERFGGISTAGIPTALFELHEAGNIRPGDLVLACGYGAGFTSAATLFAWNVRRRP